MAYRKATTKDDLDMLNEVQESNIEENTAETPQEDILDAALEAQITQIGKKTAEQLKKYPQEKIIIPLDPLNKQDKYVFVSINDWDLRIERNKAIKLPSPVVEMLEEGGYRPSRVR